MKPVYIVSGTLKTPALNNIALDQTTAGAGSFTLAGALASGGVIPDLGAGYRLDIESAGNVSTANFTFVGTDVNGAALTEVIAGPNATTVTTTGYFRTIPAVTVDAAVGTNTSIGTTDELVTKTIPTEIQVANTSLAVDISGTINFTVQDCYERVTAGQTPNWLAITALTTKTADTQTALTAPVAAFRLVVNSYTAGATFNFAILPEGTFR